MLLVVTLVIWLLLLSTWDLDLVNYPRKGVLCLPSKLLPSTYDPQNVSKGACLVAPSQHHLLVLLPIPITAPLRPLHAHTVAAAMCRRCKGQ